MASDELIDRVKNLSQFYSPNEIVQILKSQGYEESEIKEAIKSLGIQSVPTIGTKKHAPYLKILILIALVSVATFSGVFFLFKPSNVNKAVIKKHSLAYQPYPPAVPPKPTPISTATISSFSLQTVDKCKFSTCPYDSCICALLKNEGNKTNITSVSITLNGIPVSDYIVKNSVDKGEMFFVNISKQYPSEQEPLEIEINGFQISTVVGETVLPSYNYTSEGTPTSSNETTTGGGTVTSTASVPSGSFITILGGV